VWSAELSATITSIPAKTWAPAQVAKIHMWNRCDTSSAKAVGWAKRIICAAQPQSASRCPTLGANPPYRTQESSRYR